METINNVELRDGTVYPDDAVLASILGDSFPYYKMLLERFERSGLTWEWRYYRDGRTWLCKVQKKKTTIVWMSAWKGYMQASVYLPADEIGEILSLPVRETVREKIRTTKNVGKSIPCIFEIREESILDDMETVMRWKIDRKPLPAKTKKAKGEQTT